MTSSMVITIISFVFGALINLLIVVYGYGRFSAHLDDLSARVEGLTSDVRELRGILLKHPGG